VLNTSRAIRRVNVELKIKALEIPCDTIIKADVGPDDEDGRDI
jgi:hypothetical protein